jgi:hypothetical protein
MHKADHLTTICGLIVQKMWKPRRLATLWAIKLLQGLALLFLFFFGTPPEDGLLPPKRGVLKTSYQHKIN